MLSLLRIISLFLMMSSTYFVTYWQGSLK